MGADLVIAFIVGFAVGGFVGLRLSILLNREAMKRGRMYFIDHNGKWNPEDPRRNKEILS